MHGMIFDKLEVARPGGMPTGNVDKTSELKAVDRVRKEFPETWLWSNAVVRYTFIVAEFLKARLQHALNSR